MKPLITKTKEYIRKTFSGVGANPSKDWNVFLAITSMLFILVSAYHVSVFFSAQGQSADKTSQEGIHVKTLDRAELTNALKSLSSRRDEYASFISRSHSFRDPSF